MRIASAPILFVFLAMGVAAPASAIFKCDAGGKVSYSDVPCDGGKVLEIKAGPSSDTDTGTRQAAKEKGKLQALERERHRREAVEERDLRKASRESAARHKKCAAHARRQKLANADVAASTGLANEKARRKARKITEDYEAACGQWYERELSLVR